MKQNLTRLSAVLLGAAFLPLATHAQLVITEVDAAGSGNANYAADWFEVRNIGSSPINLTGWKMYDSSAAFTNAVAIRGITSLARANSPSFSKATRQAQLIQ